MKNAKLPSYHTTETETKQIILHLSIASSLINYNQNNLIHWFLTKKFCKKSIQIQIQISNKFFKIKSSFIVNIPFSRIQSLQFFQI